ncbi:hypothetical protein OC861_003050 [Tilletia horrida]|nr:hypothetical protein OC845_002728 [Tilletia horrida]KAK0566771.1 hypothetical protein OC861_003050 [Tilletia horrida]
MASTAAGPASGVDRTSLDADDSVQLTDFTESIAWTAETEPTAGEVVEKENLVKEIIANQDSLRALLNRVNSVKDDCTKAESENETLQTYVESVTKSLAAASSNANGGKRR